MLKRFPDTVSHNKKYKRIQIRPKEVYPVDYLELGIAESKIFIDCVLVKMFT